MLLFKPFSVRLAAPVAAAMLLFLVAVPASAHQEVSFDGYDLEVGMINEPVYVGDKSGLEFSVMKDGQPVTGLETTLNATTTYNGQTRDLTIDARDGADGWYESFFIPTASGGYTFHIFGTIEGNAFDQTFNATPDGYGPVAEAQGNQFPNQLPSTAELVDQAARGAKAADQVVIAIGVGAAGLVVGLVAIGLALAGRRRRS